MGQTKKLVVCPYIIKLDLVLWCIRLTCAKWQFFENRIWLHSKICRCDKNWSMEWITTFDLGHFQRNCSQHFVQNCTVIIFHIYLGPLAWSGGKQPPFPVSCLYLWWMTSKKETYWIVEVNILQCIQILQFKAPFCGHSLVWFHWSSLLWNAELYTMPGLDHLEVTTYFCTARPDTGS